VKKKSAKVLRFVFFLKAEYLRTWNCLISASHLNCISS